MLNAIWAFMILLAVIYGAFTGHMSEVTNAALDSAGEAISLCVTMAGVVALWMGLMEIAQKAGLVRKLTRGISPFLGFLFPGIPDGHPAKEYIAANVIANVLGLGWACTPAGLKAMEELAKLEAERGNPEYLEEDSGRTHALRNTQSGQEGRVRRASNEMCTFLILNISSLQLIPVNMIAYRAQYGSARPTAIIAPAIAATLFSSLVAVVYCKIKDRAGKGRMGRAGAGELAAGEIRGRSGKSGPRQTSPAAIWPGNGNDRGGMAV